MKFSFPAADIRHQLSDPAVRHPFEFAEGETELKVARGSELAVVTVRRAAEGSAFSVVDVQARQD